MHFYSRALIASLALLFACAEPRLFAQEAVERTTSETETTSAESTTEPEKTEPDVETAPKSSKRDSRVLQDMMTADEFKAAGLDKLSSEELKNLNAWLQGYRQTAETKAAEKATAEATKKAATESRAKLDQILSRVDGDFNGLTGNTVIKLEDGSVWRQANKEDRMRAQVTYRPPVAVMHGIFGYKMRVVGTGEFYVNPVKK